MPRVSALAALEVGAKSLRMLVACAIVSCTVYVASARIALNAETYAEMCRTEKDCRSMTYVLSMKTCWLNAGLPPPFPPGGSDYTPP